MLRLLTMFLVSAGALQSCTPAQNQHKLTPGDFELQTLDGRSIDLSAMKGKTVFLNVWATWCRPCIQEMPTIAVAMEQLKEEDIVFLFASSEEVDDIIAFSKRRQFPFNYVRLTNLEKLSIEAIPATFIFNPSGELIFGEEGSRDWSTTENLKLLTRKP